MDAFLLPSDAERELEELRRRAYRRDSDIQRDPAALARLMELEAARTIPPHPGAAPGEPAAVDGPPGDRTPRYFWHRLTSTSTRWYSLAAGALVVVAFAVAWLGGPHPDATLQKRADEADALVLSLLALLGANPDLASIRGFEPHRGLEPWFSVEKQGQQCFMIVDRASRSVDGANCVPPGVDLFVDFGAWPRVESADIDDLPDGSIIRFHYRGNSVDVFVFPASEAD